MRLPFVLALALMLGACRRESPAIEDAATPGDAATPSAASAAPAAPASAALPALDDACARDADCAVGTREPTGPHACCHMCNARAATKASLARLDEACLARLDLACAPTHCVAPPTSARCEAGRCVVAR